MKLANQLLRQAPFWAVALLLASYTYLLAKPLDLTIADLGRHLINGREILQGNWQVLFKNTYSFTLPDQPFVNHHWLSGVIFYLVYAGSGFVGLHIFHTAVLLLFLTLFFILLTNKANWQTAFFLTLFSLLFLASRTEVRPESFGAVLLIIYLLVLENINRQKKLRWQEIWGLAALQILWVNFHISFIFGPFIFGLYWLVQFFSQKTLPQKENSKLLKTIVLMSVINLLNPNGIRGALAPLTIFGNYGYRVFENQNLWFLREHYPGPIIPLYFLTTLVVVIALSNRFKSSLFDKFMAGVGVVLGFLALRNLPLFVVFCFPLLAGFISDLYQKCQKRFPLKIERPAMTLFTGMIVAAGLLLITIHSHPVFGKHPSRGVGFGLINNQQKMLDSLQQKIPSKAVFFNNYDIGSMLVFALYPKNKVFVDNRPEAFSVDFWQSQYIPMQNEERQWQQSLEKFEFEYLVVGHRDLTAWTQKFLKNRSTDEQWTLIYQDKFIVIFQKAS